MPNYKVICRYCDHRWKEYIYQESQDVFCPRCRDRDIEIVKPVDAFGYNVKAPELYKKRST